jgi:hypothetical protein
MCFHFGKYVEIVVKQNIIISPTNDCHCIVHCMKSKVENLGILCASIAINDEFVLLTIEGKWLKVIVNMLEDHYSICFVQDK